MKKDFLKVSILIVFALALIGGVSFLINETKPSPTQVSETKTTTISLSIQDVYEAKQVIIAEGETVLTVLEKLNKKDPQLTLSTKTYEGLGVLVEGMGTHKNGADKKYWQYKVNGVMPQIGADQYILKTEDSIEWFFATSKE
ncbi:MAG: Uncharacterized protein Greene07147_189 [Parcubacteria group bacterium Greene0714_7]|nr:MAG: Uncharacterized protein Greene07147_189 [Parcubacteria group bacterium Greene0714_7]